MAWLGYRDARYCVGDTQMTIGACADGHLQLTPADRRYLLTRNYAARCALPPDGMPDHPDQGRAPE